MMNGEVPHPPGTPGMLEETLHQMNILIQENRDLKGERGGPLGCRAGIHFAFMFIRMCPLLRVAASDQPGDEGALRGFGSVAGKTAGGAGLSGEPAEGGAGSHGGAGLPEPGAERESWRGRETRGGSGRLASEEIKLALPPLIVLGC